MDKLLEDIFSDSDMEDDPDAMDVPGCGMNSLLTPTITNNNNQNVSITPVQNFTSSSLPGLTHTENLQTSDNIKPLNQSTVNLNLSQMKPASGPTKTSSPAVKNICVNINGKMVKLNTEKAVVVPPSILQSLGGLPRKINTSVMNNSISVNNNVQSIQRLPQTHIAGQKIIVPQKTHGIPIHPSGKISKINMANTVRIDPTALQSMGLLNTGQFKRVVMPNQSAASTSTPQNTQQNGAIHFQIGPGNDLVRVPNSAPQMKIVGNGMKILQNGARTIQNGVGPMQNGVRSLQNGVRPIQNGVRPQNGIRPILNGARPIQNGVRPIQNGVRPIQNGGRLIQNGVRPMQNGNRPTFNGVRTIQNGGGTIPFRGGAIPATSTSTSSAAARFQIGPNNKILRMPRQPDELNTFGGGKVLMENAVQFRMDNNGRLFKKGPPSEHPNPQQIISRVVNIINNGNVENFDSSGIARFVERHMDPNSGKRKFPMGLDGSLVQKRGRVLEEEVENEEELGVAETYATYMPSKLKLGQKHPDPVVETASLSSVAPVDVWFELKISTDTIDSGCLSALQLESITYASQAHEQLLPDGSRAGFLIGDGAGVGKGRTIAGIILENFLRGRERAIWVSISNDLKYDAERDLADIGAPFIPVHQLNKIKYNAKISSEVNGYIKKGVLFCTYSSLIGESNMSHGKYINRRDQILQWCKESFDGVMVFDECHKAKNLCPSGSMKSTKTGKMVLELQEHLPKARVLYASATGASEPKNMAYMVRLGLWGEGTTFNTFEDFTSAVEERGVGGMEIVAMDMKLRGMYIARQLSFQDVKFEIKEVPLSSEFVKIYNTSVKLWVDALHKFTKAEKLVAASNNMKKSMWGQFWSAHQRFFKYLCIAAKVNEAVNLAHYAIKYKNNCVVIGLQSTGEARTLDQLEKNDGELNDFVSTATGVFQNLVEKHFPSSNRDNINKILSNLLAAKQPQQSTNGMKPITKIEDERALLKKKQKALLGFDDSDSDSDESVKFDSDDDDETSAQEQRRLRKQREAEEKVEQMNNHINMIFGKAKKKDPPKVNKKDKDKGNPELPTPLDMEEANEMKEDLLRKIHKLGKKLPKNTLDELIDNLGGPSEVAEMTGRKGRVVQTDNGIQYESRSEQDAPLETLNVTEKRRFMDGEKNVAIISEAASSGISLQSDRRAINQKKRLHITLELPWSADKAVQQFGRTHRSNQVSAPEYVFLITNLAGERRFASIVAKRLESLGALTHGDRRASESRDLSQFNIDNKYGKAALESVMRAVVGRENPIIPPPKDYKGNFFKDVAEALIGVGLIERKGESLTLDKEYNQMPKFLNRILGLPVDLQNRLFKYFTDSMNAIISRAKRNGTFDLGILDLGISDDEFIKRVQTTTFMYRHATGIAPIELHKLKIERGTSWKDAMQVYRDEVNEEEEGFYESYHSNQGKRFVLLLTKVETKWKMYDFDKEETKFIVYRPNTGKQNKKVTIAEIEVKYKKAEPDNVKNMWMEQYNSTVCTHVYSNGKCRKGAECFIGLRIRIYHVLAGSVLPIWQKIEAVISEHPTMKNKMQVLRLKTTDDRKIVGTLIKNHLVDRLIALLREVSESVEEQDFPEKSD